VDGFSTDQFLELMRRLAEAWESRDTEAALGCFTEDAVYMEPPDVQLFIGREQLRPYFGALAEGTLMRWHNLWFDEERQVGAGEYTFGLHGVSTADHGVAVVHLRDGRISFWREYQRKGPSSLDDFLDQEGKDWDWHIGNYS
jgi:ketosteroid isomerase-like protein